VTAAAAEQKRSTPPGRSSSSWHMDWPEISETGPAPAPAAAPVGRFDEEERWSWLDGRSEASSFDGERSVGEDGDRSNLAGQRRQNNASFSSSFSSSTTARGSTFVDSNRGGDIEGPVLETVGDWVRTVDPSSKRCYWANPVGFSPCASSPCRNTHTHKQTHKHTQTHTQTQTQTQTQTSTQTHTDKQTHLSCSHLAMHVPIFFTKPGRLLDCPPLSHPHVAYRTRVQHIS
jgi:hypothetical protein